MADPQSDAEKIRLKRLAKLQSSVPSPSTSSGPSTPKPAHAPVPAASVSKPSTPKIQIKPAPTPSTSKTVSATPQAFAESYAEWEANAITKILNVTLDRQAAEDSSWETVYLKALLQELQEEEVSTVPTLAIVDRLLISRLSIDPTQLSEDPEILTVLASLPPEQTSFEYLAGCWKRCSAERSKLAGKKTTDANELSNRLRSLDTIKNLLVSYIGFVLQDPSMFPQPEGKPVGSAELISIILSSTSSQAASSVIPPNLLFSFLTDICKRFTPSPEFSDEDSLLEVLGPTLSGLSRTISAKNLSMAGSDWQEPVRALANLSEIKPIASLMTELDDWSPNVHPALFEIQSFLGPIMRLGCFPDRFPDVAKTWFPNPSDSSPQNTETVMNTLRASIKTHQAILVNLFNNIVRSSPKARENVLKLFAKVLATNSKRSGMQVDHRTVASDSFMVNMQHVLLSLSTPFIDGTYSKIDKVDIDYFRKAKRFDLSDETKVHATKPEWDEYVKKEPTDATPPNFISEIFFLAAWSLHLGYMPVVNTMNTLSRHFHNYGDHLREIEADTSWIGTPQEPAARAQIEKIKKDKSRIESHLLAVQVQLLDPTFVGLQTGFSNFLMTWLVRCVDPVGKHPQVPIVLPLPETAPEAFNMLPEFLFDDVIGFFTAVSRMNPELLAAQPLNDLLTFMIVFLSTPYLKNPYIKGKFVEILYYNTRRSRDNSQGALGDIINVHPLALKYLLPALMRIFVDIETTGHHTQFYDKFNIRYYVAMIFRVIWTNPTHREALRKEAARVDQFVRFINLLINDTTYLLDESLTNLQTIRSVQKLKLDQVAWNALDEEQKKDKDSQLKQAERTAKMDINLCNETVRLLKLLTEETSQPFARPEIVDRLAAMLNYNVNLLAGPQSQDLKVDNMHEYKWQPKILLSDVLAIYLHLSHLTDFQAALAREGRSYSKELFDRAENIARRTAIKTEDELLSLRQLIEKVEVIRADDAADDEMGEVPDEFLDPLTYALMRDPVYLPQSKQSIDRSSIVQHLLSDPRDPFTSTPLKIEDVVPDSDLKQKIDDFIAKRREERTKQTASTPMDLDS